MPWPTPATSYGSTPDIPLQVAAPFGCGIQTGAGAVLNSLHAPAGSSIAVFGTGAVGSVCDHGRRDAGCTTIVGIDRNHARLAVARSWARPTSSTPAPRSVWPP